MKVNGVKVQFEPGEGYFWKNGFEPAEGYFETETECADSIRQSMARPVDDRAARAQGWPERY